MEIKLYFVLIILLMNEVWVNSLRLHHKRLYPGEPSIDIEYLL
jgi:hypothetical protein